MTAHPAIAPGRTAVITGGASGIGLAAARRLAGLGLSVCIADLPGERLDRAAAGLSEQAGADRVLAVATDVSRLDEMQRLRDRVHERFDGVGLLLANAGIGGGSIVPWEKPEQWRRLIEVNLWGVIHALQVFTPAMIADPRPAAIVATGSKQGITTPPGDTAYNISKAGVKVAAEQLAFALRSGAGPHISVHLLVPGYTFTGINGADGGAPKPDEAWTPEQVVDFMLAGMAAGDFYLICPDNAVPRALDEMRIRWAADDIIRNRPPLSRWHPDHKEAFERFLRGEPEADAPGPTQAGLTGF
jgi:NAD(P)-dependent dehydrogenase (short-subunit alcohol dehydrogenase family)